MVQMAYLAGFPHFSGELVIGSKAWLSTKYLYLQTGLAHKFVLCFIGPFNITEAISPIAYPS